MSKKKVRLRFKLIALGLAFVFGLSVGEVIVRVAVPTVNVRRCFRPGIYAEDPSCGWANQSGYAGSFSSYYENTPVKTNSLGMRGPELEADENERDIRVLCLGDSNTFGRGVRDDETYPAALAKALGDSGKSVAMWNTGVCGYNTTQELAAFDKYTRDLKPNVVILGWLPNDINPHPNYPKVMEGYLAESDVAFARFKERTLDGRVWERSQLAKLASVKVRGWRHNRKLERRIEENRAIEADPERFDENMKTVLELRRRSEAIGAKFFVIVYTTETEVLSNEPAPTVVKFTKRMQELGIPHLPVQRLFREEHDRNPESLFVPRDYGHPNARGHRLTAEALAPMILSELEETE